MKIWSQLVWNAFRDLAHNILGNAKAPNYIELVELEHMIDSYKKYGVQYVFKNTLLTFALGFFLQTLVTHVTNMGSVSTRILQSWKNGLLLEINQACLTARKLNESDCEHARFCCCISVNVCIRTTLKLKIFKKRELRFLLSFSDSAPKNL